MIIISWRCDCDFNFYFFSPLAGPVEQQQQRLYSGRQAVRPEPNAAAPDCHRAVFVIVFIAFAQVVSGRIRQDVHRRRPRHASPVLGHVRQPLPAARVRAVAGASSAVGAEVRRVRPARTAAVQLGRQGQAENRRSVRRHRARRAQLSHRRGQAADAGHARLDGRSRSPRRNKGWWNSRINNIVISLYNVIYYVTIVRKRYRYNDICVSRTM